MTLFPTDAYQWRDATINTCRLIPPRLLAAERDLVSKKWFAYRFATPWQATRHFADLYREGFKRYIRFNRDCEEAEKCKGLPSRIFSHANHYLTQLWQARQRADELGLPYELLIEFGFEFAGRRKRRRAPTPLQLFPSEEAGPAWAAKLETFLEMRLPAALAKMTEAPQYRTEHYKGLPVQDEFRAHVSDYILNAPGSWSGKVGAVCARERFLPMQTGIELVPEQQRAIVLSDIEQDQELGMLSPAPTVELKPLSLMPGCFGLLGARDCSSEVCNNCAVTERCGKLVAAVTADMTSKHGNVSPVKVEQDRKRTEGTRKRVAKHRAKQRALAAPNGPEPLLLAGAGTM